MIHNGHVVYASWQENGKRRGPGISEVKKQKPWKKGRARVRSRRELPRFENSRNVEMTPKLEVRGLGVARGLGGVFKPDRLVILEGLKMVDHCPDELRSDANRT